MGLRRCSLAADALRAFRSRMGPTTLSLTGAGRAMSSNSTSGTEGVLKLPLPKPLITSFDAYGTLYEPVRPVGELYAEIAREYGFPVTGSEAESRFKTAYKHLANTYPNFGKHSDISLTSWWSELVKQALGFEKLGEKEQECIDRVLQCFGTREAYTMMEDLPGTLDALGEAGICLAVLSNADSRVHGILQDMELAQKFAKVFVSYETELEKPRKEAFDLMIDTMFDIKCLDPSIKPQVETYMEKSAAKPPDGHIHLPIFWHVGDDPQYDLEGAAKVPGCGAILIDHMGVNKGQYFSSEKRIVERLKEGEEITDKLGNKIFYVSDDILLLVDQEPEKPFHFKVAIRHFSAIKDLFGV